MSIKSNHKFRLIHKIFYTDVSHNRKYVCTNIQSMVVSMWAGTSFQARYNHYVRITLWLDLLVRLFNGPFPASNFKLTVHVSHVLRVGVSISLIVWSLSLKLLFSLGIRAAVPDTRKITPKNSLPGLYPALEFPSRLQLARIEIKWVQNGSYPTSKARATWRNLIISHTHPCFNVSLYYFSSIKKYLLHSVIVHFCFCLQNLYLLQDTPQDCSCHPYYDSMQQSLHSKWAGLN